MYPCEAKCGKEVRVYGCRWCPECYDKYSKARFFLDFMPPHQEPMRHLDGEEVLLMNTCDGYHLAYVRFDNQGDFQGFSDFLEEKWFEPGEFFQCWAPLPDVIKQVMPIVCPEKLTE